MFVAVERLTADFAGTKNMAKLYSLREELKNIHE